MYQFKSAKTDTTMTTATPNPKLNLNREVVISFNPRKGKKLPGNAGREAVFTCCDGASYATTPFRKG